ncbi:MoaD/ThiS family protein [Desulfospira joergensenii]|uniref:MoaD/ThiS family protein n=1 Tax=Desulfospira joergensenii TaxID=53329 RepID=UPI0003B74E56|nr:MoaD/ThiS family protein [Desulfospira joergensenii]
MPTIVFNAFSFLQKKLRKKNIAYSDASMDLKEGTTPRDLLGQVGLTREEVEVVFINGKVGPFDTVLRDNDRVAFVPPGTPGPYRVYLGFKNKDNV